MLGQHEGVEGYCKQWDQGHLAQCHGNSEGPPRLRLPVSQDYQSGIDHHEGQKRVKLATLATNPVSCSSTKARLGRMTANVAAQGVPVAG